MKILHLSDTHFAKQIDDPELKNVLEKQLSLEDKIQLILKQEKLSSFDFVMVTGDLVHEGLPSDYQDLQQLLEKYFAPLPIYLCLGNHDQKPVFYEGMGEDKQYENYDYHFEYQGVQIFVMDSAKNYSHSGILDLEQIQWLSDHLASTKGPFMIFQHHPIIGDPYFINFTMEESNPILKAIDSDRLIAVFTGHTHSPAINWVGRVKQYTNYAISFGLEKTNSGSQLFTNTCGYSVIEYGSDGQVTVAPRIILPTYQVYKSTSLDEMDQLNKSYEH